MACERTYHVVDRGTRLPGGSITWRTEVEASDYFFASEVCAKLQRAGHLFRRREIYTTRSIPVTPAEAAWHAERLRKRNERAATRPYLYHHNQKD